jgi:hypothetical protein
MIGAYTPISLASRRYRNKQYQPSERAYDEARISSHAFIIR